MIQSQNRIRPVVYGLAAYFLLAATDCFNVGAVGSMLKVVAFLPIALAVFDLTRLRLRIHPLLVVQLLFWTLAVVSLFYSVKVERTLSSLITLTLNLVLVFLLGLVEQYNRRELDLLERAMLLGSWLTIILMLIFSDVSEGGRLSLRLGSITQDQNYINGFYLYAFSYHCGQLLQKRNRIHMIPVLLILVIVLMTGSRGALLAFAVSGFVHLCIFFADSRHALRNCLLVLVLLLLLAIVFDLVLAQMPEAVSQRFSWEQIAQKGTTGRTRIWRFLWNHFSTDSIPRMLFGHGYGTSSLVNTMNHLVAHNLYLDNLITLGASGVILQLVTQGMVAWILLRRKHHVLLGAYAGMIGMCLSLSLVAYKPILNIMLMALAIDVHAKTKETSL